MQLVIRLTNGDGTFNGGHFTLETEHFGSDLDAVLRCVKQACTTINMGAMLEIDGDRVGFVCPQNFTVNLHHPAGIIRNVV
jgi:hypothetical protein